MTHFFLHLIELRDYDTAHKCVVIEVVDRHKLLVELDPPIEDFIYKRFEPYRPEDVLRRVDDLHRVVLAPRNQGSSLTPAVSEWPCRVNILIPEADGDLQSGPWSLHDIGEITKDGKLPDEI